MTTDTTKQTEHRRGYEPSADAVTLREPEMEDGVFIVRLPIASTGEVRNAGDDPLTRDEIEGMARQVNDRTPAVFLDHGKNATVADSRYSALGKIGEWQNADLVDGDGETLLEAGARMMDPETLPAATGTLREALAIIKSQIERGLGLAASIGWSDDQTAPGGVDLMEASLVGIPADPRTTTDVDVDAVLEARGAAVTTPRRGRTERSATCRALVRPRGDRDRADTPSAADHGTAFYYEDRLYVVEPTRDDGDRGADEGRGAAGGRRTRHLLDARGRD